jgi:FixJ family two-component response regulator
VTGGLEGAGPGEGQSLVLVVDDDPSVALTLRETLQLEFSVRAVTEPQAALAALERGDVAVLLADQQMPGLGGVQLIIEAHRRHPDVVAVLITAHADLDLALQAINTARAFAFLTKPWDVDELLVVVRRAVDAHRALRRQRETLLDLRQRELFELRQLAHSTPAPLTARRFGAGPLHERQADVFQQLLDRYASLLDHAFAQRIHRIDYHVSDDLARLADELGALRAGPRDVMELHTTVLGRHLAHARLEETEAYAEEARLLVLELMGHLVSCYRAYTLGVNG